MNTPGTIDRPGTRDPRKQTPMTPTPEEPAGSVTENPTTRGTNDSHQNRTREMQLIPEALARAHMNERLREAERERRITHLVTARRMRRRAERASLRAHRMQRRAERASLRARRAIAMAVMQ